MSAEKVYGWVLLPVAVDKGHENDLKAYEFENDHAYFEAEGTTPWGFSEAPTYEDALKTMEARLG